MRVFVPATMPLLARLHDHGSLPVTARVAVTDAFRSEHPEVTDAEELEYLAMAEAARRSVDLVAADPDAARRRVVIAVDDPGDELRLDQIASVHIDDDDAVEAIHRAADIVRDGGECPDEVDEFELMWFAPQELSVVLTT